MQSGKFGSYDNPVRARYTGGAMKGTVLLDRGACLFRWGLFLLLGGVATLAQVVFMREFLTVAYGNELCLGLLFFFWFLGVGLGARLGGWAASRVVERSWWLFFLFVAMVFAFGAQLGVIRALRYLLRAASGEYLSLGRLAWGALVGITPFSFVVGLIFPFAGQVARGEERAASPGGVSTVYILEAAGSLTAGVLFTYVLLGRVAPFGLAKAAAVLVVALCFALAVVEWKRRRAKYQTFPSSQTETRSRDFSRVEEYQSTGLKSLLRPHDWKGSLRPIREAVRVLLLFAVLVFLAALSAGDLEKRTTALRWRSQFPGLRLVKSRETPYERLDLAESEGQYSLYGNGQLIGTFPDPYSYLEPVHCALVQHASPFQVLLVGGNLEMIQLILQHGVGRVDWVQLDPALMDLMLRYSSSEQRDLLRDRRVRLFFEDGRRFIQNCDTPYDLILLDVPDPSTAQLNRYYTEEFYAEAKRALKRDGVLVTSIQASVHATGEEVVAYGKVIFSALQRTFRQVAVQPGQSYRFFACAVEGQVSEAPEVLAGRYRRRGVEPAAFAFGFPVLFQPDRVEELRSALESPPRPEANTDFRPVAYIYQLLVWNRWAGSDVSGWLLALRARSPLWMLAVLGVLLGARWLALRRKGPGGRRRFDLALAIAVLGLTGMSVELVLLFAFQNHFGVLYQKIAMFIALFMFGLTMGSLGMNLILERRRLSRPSRTRVLLRLLVISTVFVLGLPVCLWLSARVQLSSPALFYGLVSFSGLLTGAAFPLVLSLYHRPEEPVARAAGVIDSMDHLGAMVGSLLTGSAWLPLWGVWTTCVILAAVNVVVLVLLRR